MAMIQLKNLEEILAQDSGPYKFAPNERAITVRIISLLQHRLASQPALPFFSELLLPDFRDHIFSYLSVLDLGRATLVCKDWSTGCVWKVAYLLRWGGLGQDAAQKLAVRPSLGKLAYALRDACESRDEDEAQSIAEAETEHLSHLPSM